MGSPLGKYFDALVLHETRLWAMVEQRVRSAEGTVTLGRFEILCTVGRAEGGCRVQDIAEALLITVGAASRIVDRLVTDGLLARSPHPTDRRSYRLGLTPDGRQALDTTAPALEEALTDLLGQLDSGLIDMLTKALHDAESHLTGRQSE
jgi:DNA-binding MarR family transcriptional regulator